MVGSAHSAHCATENKNYTCSRYLLGIVLRFIISQQLKFTCGYRVVTPLSLGFGKDICCVTNYDCNVNRYVVSIFSKIHSEIVFFKFYQSLFRNLFQPFTLFVRLYKNLVDINRLNHIHHGGFTNPSSKETII